MTPRERAGVVAVLFAMGSVVLDAGLVNLALPMLGASFHVSPARAILVVSAYQAALLATLLPAAQVAERFGYRLTFVVGVAVSSAAAILAASAPSFLMLLAARILQGLGGAAVMAVGIALLRFALGSERLGAAIAWNALTVALCAAAAPLVGGLVLSVAPWPWLFLVKLPLGGLALAAATLLPEVRTGRRSLDLIGIALHAVTAATILFAVEEVRRLPLLAFLLASGAAAGATLSLRRHRGSDTPLLPLDLLRVRRLRLAVLASICCFAGQSAGHLALPLYLQLTLGHGAMTAGLVLSCWPLSVAATSAVANRLTARFESPRMCAAGASVLACGLLLSALLPVRDSVWPLACGTMLCGSGFGLFQVPNNRTMFLSVPVDRSAAAGGLQGSARLAGQLVGAVTMSLLFACSSNAMAPRAGFALSALFAAGAALVSARALSPTRSACRPAGATAVS